MTVARNAVRLIAAIAFPIVLCAGPGLSAAFAEPVVTIRNNGPSSNRVDLVVVGDGYTSAELQSGKYASDVETAVQGMFGQDPYWEYQQYYNVHRIDVTSAESGADHPELGSFKNTALGAAYNCAGIQRLICVDTTKVNDVVSTSIPAADARDIVLVIVNDTVYGGSGGAIAVASTNAAAIELVLHELGHSFARLADEYTSQPPTCDNSVEPPEPNATRETQRAAIKWSVWIEASTPIPTTTTTPSVPGLYEGSKYCPTGLYRPTYDSKMRNLNRPFEQINTEAHVKRVYSIVTPLDSWSPSSPTISVQQGATQTFTATALAPLTHALAIEWAVDGVNVASGTPFALSTASLAIGDHTVQLSVRDSTAMVRNDPGQLLRTTRTWTISVLPSFTDEPLTSATLVKAVHITELRSRINTVRAQCGLQAFSFTDPSIVAGVTLVRAVHLLELRTALAQAYAACGETPPTYTDPSLAASSVIRAVHISELRAAIRALE
jgi:hypothetical protein